MNRRELIVGLSIVALAPSLAFAALLSLKSSRRQIDFAVKHSDPNIVFFERKDGLFDVTPKHAFKLCRQSIPDGLGRFIHSKWEEDELIDGTWYSDFVIDRDVAFMLFDYPPLAKKITMWRRFYSHVIPVERD